MIRSYRKKKIAAKIDSKTNIFLKFGLASRICIHASNCIHILNYTMQFLKKKCEIHKRYIARNFLDSKMYTEPDLHNLQPKAHHEFWSCHSLLLTSRVLAIISVSFFFFFFPELIHIYLNFFS